MGLINFFTNRLDKHKTLSILFLPRLQLHESFLCFFFLPGPGNPGWKHAAFFSMQDAKLFSTRLTFFSSTSILFAFSFFLLSFSFLFSHVMTLPLHFYLLLCFFSPPQGPQGPQGPTGFPGSTPPYFPCEAWTKNLHGKTPHPLFDSLPFAFS